MNKKNIGILVVILIIVITGGFLAWKNSQKKERINQQKTWNNNNNENLKGNFSSILGPAEEELIFSIPEDAKIPSACFTCEERGIDQVEGQYWNFVVSSDYESYAYTASNNNKVYVILNGEKKKEYNRAYMLQFSSNGEDFIYHAYDKEKNVTCLVYNDKEIIAYFGEEGWPQAANGFTEAFSDDGKHFAYSKITQEDNNRVHIVLDGETINVVDGLDALLIEFDDNTIEYIIGIESRTGSYYDYDYYRGDKFVKTLNYDEFNSFQIKHYTYVEKDSLIKLDGKNKSVLVNNAEIANYRSNNPEVYLSYLMRDNSMKNFAYIITTNIIKDDVWVSLNGKDSESKYNDVKDMHFSEDGNKLVYIGRMDRNIYKVTHEIIPSK